LVSVPGSFQVPSQKQAIRIGSPVMGSGYGVFRYVSVDSNVSRTEVERKFEPKGRVHDAARIDDNLAQCGS
jgi:hypothetical protein